MSARWILVACSLTAACGAPLVPEAPKEQRDTPAPPPALAPPAPPPTAEGEPGASEPPAPPQLAGESTAPGIVPLGQAEQKEMNEACDPFLAKLRGQVQGELGRIGRTEKLLELVESDGTVDARCRELMTRGLRAYLAATHEATATMILKQALVGLSSHLATAGRLCESASPGAAAWACVRTDVSEKSRFRYRLTTDGDAYELSATGSPVDGAGETVLFIAGQVTDGAIDLGAPVMRRAP